MTVPAETLSTGVLVIGGGPAATWAAISAAESGVRVILVDKGYCGTSGATAAGGNNLWASGSPAGTQGRRVDRLNPRGLLRLSAGLRILRRSRDGLRCPHGLRRATGARRRAPGEQAHHQGTYADGCDAHPATVDRRTRRPAVNPGEKLAP
ncbi:hypothetical protein A5755_15505 [Mycolicibacterium fortuitum]|nr:hypothetical protein A5754_01980 [Mycolicibacterium fortuitum]OBB71535.1 hypothetical protein A5755_15505 [Mycolicibacterium fortuitum]OBF68928.1 hypothetical protein A5751_33360 [Mycolicibacterium fortuitum]OBG24877.1 hypothetical protein A5768_01840 [Mycolicibacterium fortuitum]